MKIALARSLVFAGFVAAAASGGGTAAKAQGFPPGSYQQSCTQIHWAGTTLVAECRRRDGRMAGTGLPDAQRCRGDIANNNGQLQCLGGQPPRAAEPSPGYGQRGPEYPRPGYHEGERREEGYGERRQRCEELRDRQRELRDRLETAPYDEHGRMEHRLREMREEGERLGCSR